MAYSLNHNTSTPTGDPDVTITTYSVDTDDFAKTTDVAGEYSMTNTQSPIGFPEKVEVTSKTIQNVYSTSGIDPSFYLPTKRGQRVHTKLTEVWSYADSEDPSKPVYALPVTATLVLTVPQMQAISKNDIVALFKRLLAVWYTDGSDHFEEWFRGSVSLK
jgi:hypothetical protein